MRPYLRAANVGWDGARLNDVKMMNFTESEMSTYRLEPGHLLLGEASGSPTEVGKPILWAGEILDCAFQNTLLRVRPHGAEPKYLLHFFRHQARSGVFAASSRGLGIHHLGREALASWKIPVPSLAVQRRIAAILDKAGDIRRCNDRAAQEVVDIERAAFVELLGNTAAKVADLAESAAYGTSEKSSTQGNFPVLRMNNVTASGEIDLRELKYMDLPERLHERYLVRPGDLLFNRTNSPELVGKTAVYHGPNPVVFAGYPVRVRANERGNAEYLSGFLNSGYGKAKLRSMAKAIVGMANINAKELVSIPIPLPPLHCMTTTPKKSTHSEQCATSITHEQRHWTRSSPPSSTAPSTANSDPPCR